MRVRHCIAGAAFVALVLLLATGAGSAFASSKVEFAVKDGDWVWKSSGKTREAPTPNGAQETEIGWTYWLYVNPKEQKEMRGEAKGLHFYSEHTKEYSFLPFDEDASINGVHFSPDGERFIVEFVEYGENSNIGLAEYTFADLAPHFATEHAAMPPLWVDRGRFVYSRYEPGTSRGLPEEYANEWVSLVLYDVFFEEETMLKEGTETSSFFLLYFNEEGDIVADESWVESTDDWADPENKMNSREIVVPVPAAG